MEGAFEQRLVVEPGLADVKALLARDRAREVSPVGVLACGVPVLRGDPMPGRLGQGEELVSRFHQRVEQAPFDAVTRDGDEADLAARLHQAAFDRAILLLGEQPPDVDTRDHGPRSAGWARNTTRSISPSKAKPAG